MQGVFQHLDAALRPDGQALVNLGLIHRENEWQPYWEAWLEWMRAHGWRRFGLYTWDQGPGLPGDWNGRLAPAFELVFHFNRTARQANKIIPCKWAGTPNKGSGLRAADGEVRRSRGVGSARPSREASWGVSGKGWAILRARIGANQVQTLGA